VQCWGYGQYGQLGDGATNDSAVPVAVSALAAGASTVTAGGEHACAVDAKGGAWCWGEDASGQLGDNGSADSAAPVAVSGLSTGVASLAAGGAHTCAVLVSGAVRCWGWNVSGQLGNGTQVDNATPVDVLGL
jgi:alpha-tubulin suppressor-like RCC1 family protein